jgi:hypothetical protein
LIAFAFHHLGAGLSNVLGRIVHGLLRREDGYKEYMSDVRNRVYPGPEHTVFMKDEELAKFKQMMDWKK